jgi:ribosomal protein L16/L10AE
VVRVIRVQVEVVVLAVAVVVYRLEAIRTALLQAAQELRGKVTVAVKVG